MLLLVKGLSVRWILLSDRLAWFIILSGLLMRLVSIWRLRNLFAVCIFLQWLLLFANDVDVRLLD
jgi:hypothetical protein